MTAQQDRSENCQVSVFLAYVTGKGDSLVDRRLYLPKSWADRPEKRSKVGVPETIKFATIAQLARADVAIGMGCGNSLCLGCGG